MSRCRRQTPCAASLATATVRVGGRGGNVTENRVVEFIGIPGSGKTTLMRTVLTRLSGAGLAPLDLNAAVVAAARHSLRDSALGPVLRFVPDRLARRLISRSHERFLSLSDALAGKPDLGIAVIDSLRNRSASAPDSDQAVRWMFETLWKHELWRRGNGANWLVLDEGFSHRAITLFGYRYGEDEGDFAALGRYLDAIPLPSLVIKVDTEPIACFERAGVPPRFRRLDREAQRRYLDAAGRCAADVAKLLTDRGVDVRVIDNNGLVEDSRAQLIDELDAWIATL